MTKSFPSFILLLKENTTFHSMNCQFCCWGRDFDHIHLTGNPNLICKHPWFLNKFLPIFSISPNAIPYSSYSGQYLEIICDPLYLIYDTEVYQQMLSALSSKISKSDNFSPSLLLSPWSKTRHKSCCFSRSSHQKLGEYLTSILPVGRSWWNDINRSSRYWVHGLFSTTKVAYPR